MNMLLAPAGTPQVVIDMLARLVQESVTDSARVQGSAPDVVGRGHSAGRGRASAVHRTIVADVPKGHTGDGDQLGLRTKRCTDRIVGASRTAARAHPAVREPVARGRREVTAVGLMVLPPQVRKAVPSNPRLCVRATPGAAHHGARVPRAVRRLQASPPRYGWTRTGGVR